MSDETKEREQAIKIARESLFQKKAALQTIYETAISDVYPPEETLRHIITLAKVSGVYIPKDE